MCRLNNEVLIAGLVIMPLLALNVAACTARTQGWDLVGIEVGDAQLQRVQINAERAWVFLDRQFSAKAPPRPQIKAFGSIEAFARGLQEHPGGRSLSPRDARLLAERIAGRAVRGEAVLLNIANPFMEKEEELLGLITHEFTHVFQYHLLSGRQAPVPAWFMEGQALLMSALMRKEYRTDGYAAFRKFYVDVLEQEAAHGRAFPRLADLPRGTDPHQLRVGNLTATRAIAFLTVELLYSKYSHKQAERFLELFQTGYNVEDNFSLAFGSSYDEFVREAEAEVMRQSDK